MMGYCDENQRIQIDGCQFPKENGTVSTDLTNVISPTPLRPWQLFPALRDQNFSIPAQVCLLMIPLSLRHHRYCPHSLAAPGLMEVPLLAEEACWLRITKTSESNLNRKDWRFSDNHGIYHVSFLHVQTTSPSASTSCLKEYRWLVDIEVSCEWRQYRVK